MAKTETKRQHYVPRTYLKHFAQERGGNYFIKALPTNDFRVEKIFEISTANICLENDLYTLPGETAEQRMLLETFYNENYESEYDKIYQLLIDPNKKELKDAERRQIISTVVTMFYRTTKWLNAHNVFFNSVLEQTFNLSKQLGKDYFMMENEKVSIAGKTLDQLQREFISESRPDQVIIQLQVALRLINIRSVNDGIFVIKLGEHSSEFVTSDNPVTYSNIKENRFIAPFDPTNMLTLPLDPKHRLLLMPYAEKDSKKLIIRQEYKDGMCFGERLTANYVQSENAERFMLGTDSGLKSYLKTKEFSEAPINDEDAEGLSTYAALLKRGKDRGLY